MHIYNRLLARHAAPAVALTLVLLPLARLSAQEAVTAPPPTGPAAPRVDQQGNRLPDQGQQEASTERVFVTGSIIPTAAEVGPNPVLRADRDLIEKSGERTTEELLRNLPISNANGIPVSNNENGSNTAVGAATIALRGFDARATLILLDGRRVAPYPTSNAGIVFVDLNSIAQTSIESVEILKDGASTTYGADAVAGVVNIKRYHEYHGAEARVEYGNTTDKDSSEFSTSLLFGVGDGKTNVSGTINYYHRNSIFNRDRDYSAIPPFLSSNASPYNLQLSSAAVAEAGGTVVGTTGTQFATPPDFTNGFAPANQYIYGAGRVRAGANGFNFNQFSLSYPESERYGGYVAMDHKFLGDSLVVYGDSMYQNVTTHNELAAPATGSFQTPGQNTIAIPPRVPNPAGTTPFGGPSYASTGLTPGAFNPFNPFNQIISGGSRARLAEFGNRIFDNETEAFLATLGVRGDKLFNGTWGYDLGGRYSEIKNTTTGTQVSASRFNRILNQADPIFDPASPEFIGTTVAFNPFGDYRSAPIASNEGSIEFARVHPTDRDKSKLTTLDGTIYTTDLFHLPAGGVGFAFGGQFRRESLSEDPDQLNVNGDVAGNSAILPAHGGRKSFAFYLETSIPIFGKDNAITGFHALDITAAGRYEEFRNNDTNVVVPKLGLRWQPFDESLTLRATWGKGFREPSLEELYTEGVFDIRASHDPMNGGAFEPETQTLIVGNPNLAPEDSETVSFGFVYSPKYVPGFTFNADFWQIDRTGVVEISTLDAVLQRELAGTLLPGEVVERFADNSIARIIIPYRNEGEQKANGVDFGIQYVWETGVGTFTSLTQVTYLNSFERTRDVFINNVFAGTVLDQRAGQSTNLGMSNEGYYRWRGNSSIDWTWKGFDLFGTVRYIDGFHEEDANLNRHDVAHRWLFDLQASYDFSALVKKREQAAAAGKDYSKGSHSTEMTAQMSIWDHLLYGTTFTVGVINLLDKDPPFASGQGGNAVGYPGFTYDATGRFVYLRLAKKF
jgi:iron complex outermembrane receptor protein